MGKVIGEKVGDWETVTEIQVGNKKDLNHSNGSESEEGRRRNVNKKEWVGFRDLLVMEDEEKASLMFSIFLMGNWV